MMIQNGDNHDGHDDDDDDDGKDTKKQTRLEIYIGTREHTSNAADSALMQQS